VETICTYYKERTVPPNSLQEKNIIWTLVEFVRHEPTPSHKQKLLIYDILIDVFMKESFHNNTDIDCVWGIASISDNEVELCNEICFTHKNFIPVLVSRFSGKQGYDDMLIPISRIFSNLLSTGKDEILGLIIEQGVLDLYNHFLVEPDTNLLVK
jgi:hypothetical protein